MSVFVIILLAFCMDKVLGEAKRFHPLVGFGNLAILVEKQLNSIENSKVVGRDFIDRAFVNRAFVERALGVLAWMTVVLPITFIFFLLEKSLTYFEVLSILVSAFICYLAIGWKSLLQHAMNIATPLKNNDMTGARQAVAMIVSRDTQSLNEEGIAKAATESVLENGADAIFSALFWFILLGIPGVVLYRLSNTLDAMWGYKNPRFLYFGWCAARIDDVLNFIPARLTALSYALVGHTKIALKCWHAQGMNWKSPNAGPVMAAGAGALNVSLGGAAQYHSQLQHRPALGPEQGDTNNPASRVNGHSIVQACDLVNRALILWLLVLAIFSGANWLHAVYGWGAW